MVYKFQDGWLILTSCTGIGCVLSGPPAALCPPWPSLKYSLRHLVFSIHFWPCCTCCGWLSESLAWSLEDILHHLSPTERYFSAPSWGLEKSKQHHWLFHIASGCPHHCPASPNPPQLLLDLPVFSKASSPPSYALEGQAICLLF